MLLVNGVNGRRIDGVEAAQTGGSNGKVVVGQDRSIRIVHRSTNSVVNAGLDEV